MDFEFSPEQKEFRRSIREFLAEECPREKARELDRTGETPLELYRKVAQRGWVSLGFPKEVGGGGGSTIDLAILQEELAYGSIAVAMSWACTVVFGGGAINFYGNEEQKQRFLPGVFSGDIRMCFALTEANAGSDAASLETSAVDNGDHFVVNGAKVFIGAATESHYAVTFARTDKTVAKHKGITAFVCDLKAPGITLRRLRKMGNWPYHSAEIVFRNAVFPRSDVLGGVNRGWTNMLKSLDLERIVASSALCCGLSQRMVDDAVCHARTVKQSGQPIIKQPAVRHALTDMQAEIDAIRLLVYRAAWMLDSGIPCSREASICKIQAAEGGARVANLGVQVLGPYGYMADWDMERHFRDVRMHSIGGGTTQIQRNILARELGL
ncbi:MAG: acyl-CoA/acyl-ACP dehydrogenase [Chloroflexi bacterium]|nr:acyl-CoA/acyl-ACP dehydrogenase [Chloroflexota bacterium]